MATQDSTIEKRSFRPAMEGEPEWLYTQRRQAWEAYQDAPLPDRVAHLWRYTEPKQFLPGDEDGLLKTLPVIPNGRSSEARMLPEGREALGYNEMDLLTLTRVSDKAAEQGVVLSDLMTASAQHSDLVQEYLGSVVGAGFGKFEALNLASWNTGLFLYVPSGTVLQNPIHLERHPGNGTTVSRLLVVVGENAEVTIVDDYHGSEHAEGMMNAVVEVVAHDSARVKYTSMLRLPDAYTIFLTQRARIGANVEMKSVSVALNGGVGKVNWGVDLVGRGANSHWNGLLMGNRKQHFDHFTGHHHAASETFSNLDFKVAATDKAVSAYTGRINIDKDAFFCEAFQENRNLLLSGTAHVESIPELEIINDEVKCSHGVTVGALEPEQIFYLMSRGLTYKEAMRIILSGFFEESLNTLPELYREQVRALIHDKMEV